MPDTYKISQLAAEFGLSYRTLRFYEERGLLAPERRGMVRLYNDVDRARLRRIVELARYDFTLIEIQRMLDMTERETLPLLHAQRRHLEDAARRTGAAIASLSDTLRELETTWAA